MPAVRFAPALYPSYLAVPYEKVRCGEFSMTCNRMTELWDITKFDPDPGGSKSLLPCLQHLPAIIPSDGVIGLGSLHYNQFLPDHGNMRRDGIHGLPQP